jgi:hypothetical protein
MASNRKRGQDSSWTVTPAEEEGQEQEQEEGEDCIFTMRCELKSS